MSPHYFLASMVSDEWLVNLLNIPCMWQAAFLLLLSTFSLSFDNLITMCLNVDPFAFILLEVWTIWTHRFVSLSNLRSFQLFFLQNFFLPLSLSLLLLGFPLYIQLYVLWCPTSIFGSVHFSSFFFISSPQTIYLQLTYLFFFGWNTNFIITCLYVCR